MAVKVFLPHELDYEEYTRMQRESFAELIKSSGVSDSFMTPDYFRWKYTPPAGPGKIAVAFEGTEMVGSNAMYPMTLTGGGVTVKGWQSCDTATIPRCRGRGHIIGCLKALEGELQPNEIFFGFPNKASMGLFSRLLHWEDKAVIPAFLKPVLFSIRRADEAVPEISEFDDSQDGLARQLSARGKSMVYRDRDYLNWRYHRHPAFSYVSFVHKTDGASQGFIVMRRDLIKGKNIALIMERWGLSSKVERRLLARAHSWCRKQRIRYMSFLDTGLNRGAAFRSGIFRVPGFLLSKKQIFMGQDTGGEARAVFQGEWHIQLGDWDVF
jgi:hypothetical protein